MGKLILSYELGKIRKQLSKRIIGLCHGGFDILHNGHLEHFEEAKKNVDILIVSVTADKFVIKGPNQPYNNEVNRAKFLLHIKYIDYVVIELLGSRHLWQTPLIKSFHRGSAPP